MKTYNYSWIDFLSGKNVIKVTNEKEFNILKNFLKEYGLLEILNKETEYSDWQRLATINGKDENIFLFEYHNHKGITWGDNVRDAIEWYGKEPINVSELQEFLDKKNMNIKTRNENVKTKKLCDLVEIEENNMNCVVLKVKENSKMDLIKLGCFEGDETLIRVSKGRDHTFTIFSGEKHYSWHHGESGYTIVPEKTDKKRYMILDCIEMDFDIYIGKDPKKIKESLNIKSLKDTYNKIYDLEIMYWNNQEHTNVCVHKNGEYLRHFEGIDKAKEILRSCNYELSFRRAYIAQTGCMVEEYLMKKTEKSQEKTREKNIDKDNENDYDYS